MTRAYDAYVAEGKGGKSKRAHNLKEVVCIGCLQDRKGALLTGRDEREGT